METVRTYLEQAVESNASDIFLIAGKAICMKRDGEIRPIDDERLMPDTSERLVRELYAMARRELPEKLTAWDDDFALSVSSLARFRVNVFQQRGSLAAVIRVVRFGIPDWREIGLTEEIMEVARQTRGLVLVTGPAGSGKSTTLTCIVDAINRSRNAHIITIEDPIEFVHHNERSVVSQRELTMDTENYVTALRASLRQAPNVIQLGEMRDLETIQTAMTAAETGHLVISTLHTVGAVNTIDRIIDVFPPQQQRQIRVQLSQILKTVISQQLLPAVGGGMVPAFEIMHRNNAVSTMIRDSRIHQIDSVIQTSAAEGMIGMDESILRLFRSGRITAETALLHAMNAEQMKKKLGK